MPTVALPTADPGDLHPGCEEGRRAKPRTSIAKACKKECPACYAAGGNCPDGANFVAAVEDDVDGTGGLVYCLEATGMTPTKPQAKCEDGVAKSLIKSTGSKSKCYDTCVEKSSRGDSARELHGREPIWTPPRSHVWGKTRARPRTPSTRCARSRREAVVLRSSPGLGRGLGSVSKPRRHADTARLLPGADDDHHDRRDNQHHHDNGRDDDDHHHGRHHEHHVRVTEPCLPGTVGGSLE